MPAALLRWLRALAPSAQPIDGRERLRVALGAGLGILLTGWLSQLAGDAALPWLVAPLGASAVLVFAVPSSPLAQPWAVVGGNTLSALIGMACAALLPWPTGAAALAVGAAIAMMLLLRCLHPPGGASALLVALGGVQDPAFALHPVLLNSLLLVLAGMLYNSLTGRPYPHRPAAPAATAIEDDLDAVLARHNQVLDISRDELRALIEDTQLQGYQRRLAKLRCGDIMSREPITVSHRTPLAEAWPLFRTHRIKALPVIDANQEVIGIVTPADFMRAAEPKPESSLDLRLRRLRDWTLRPGNGLPERVGDIMSRQVRVASVDRHLAELIPVFGSTGHHHIPIVDAERKLVGMLTQSDVVAALCRSGEAAAG